MQLAVSPYHLTTRDPAAMAALLLADHVITMLPVPPSGVDRESVILGLRASPPYARLLESWRWAAPLFGQGLISSLAEGEDPLADATVARRRISSEGCWQPLRPFMHEGPLVGIEYLDRVATDLLKGGPDPGWSLPIVAGLDALAARRGLIVVRAGGGGPTAGLPRARSSAWRGSVAQVAEWRLGKQLFAVAVPMFTQAAAETILRARKAMAQELRGLREGIAAAVTDATRANIARVREAAKEYSSTFGDFIDARGGHGRDDAEGQQALDGFMRVTALRLPSDAALLAAKVASSQLRTPGRSAGEAPPQGQVQRPLVALVIESMSAQPRARA